MKIYSALEYIKVSLIKQFIFYNIIDIILIIVLKINDIDIYIYQRSNKLIN